ncbi:hypothetical protein HU200_042054 [Digitaria exilis]|uniref:Neprosin PEP catalytic domain-containing protein n=1 Tax=Digitaria exilis TaxID=1010633 RepID=A0A835B5U3_9POAL|nr:hypothetical protein HU200_042054 [Digitaria exilis]
MPANVNREVASTNHSFRLFGRPTGETVQNEANGKEEIAAAYSVAGPYHGAYAAIPIWRTRVEPNEFSKSYLLIGGTVDRTYRPIRGKDPPDITYQIAVGMANDGGVKSRCLNLECGGFIQTNSKYALGTSFRNSDSQVGGQTYYITVGIYRIPGEPVWRVSLNGDEIGHIQEGTFPMGFFESLHNEMGGRILNTNPGGRHTMTQMGSGMYASSGPNNAATIAFYMAVNNNGGDQLDNPVNSIVTSPKCYDVMNYGNDKVRPGYDVGFGGPGGYYCNQS